MDPVTMGIMVGSQVLDFGMDLYNQNQAQKKSDQFMGKIQETADVMQEKYEEIFSIADYFKPGGAAWREAEGQAISKAMTTARSGEEKLLAKGIDLTSYGSGTFRDVVSADFTSDLMDRKHDLTQMGSTWTGMGTSLMGDWADLLSGGYEQDLKASLAALDKKSEATGEFFTGDTSMFSDPDLIKNIVGTFKG
tara:strand:- start:34 stop:612 length:579 start_codon:yes stop_codon:yes gene_type:complete